MWLLENLKLCLQLTRFPGHRAVFTTTKCYQTLLTPLRATHPLRGRPAPVIGKSFVLCKLPFLLPLPVGCGSAHQRHTGNPSFP